MRSCARGREKSLPSRACFSHLLCNHRVFLLNSGLVHRGLYNGTRQFCSVEKLWSSTLRTCTYVHTYVPYYQVPGKHFGFRTIFGAFLGVLLMMIGSMLPNKWPLYFCGHEWVRNDWNIVCDACFAWL